MPRGADIKYSNIQGDSKCVVTEVVLFSIAALKTLTFHKVV